MSKSAQDTAREIIRGVLNGVGQPGTPHTAIVEHVTQALLSFAASQVDEDPIRKAGIHFAKVVLETGTYMWKPDCEPIIAAYTAMESAHAQKIREWKP